MKDIFDLIEKVFGAAMLKTAAAAVVVYFATLGLFKLAESLRSFSRHKRIVEREKSSLEILKLRYEIEAIRKTHSLPELIAIELEAKPEESALVRMAPMKGWSLVWRLTVLLISNVALLCSANLIFLLARYVLAGHTPRSDEWLIVLAITILGLGFAYLSLWKVGPSVKSHSLFTFRVIWGLAAAIAVAVLLWGFIEQEV